MRPKRWEINQQALDRVRAGRFAIDDDTGALMSVLRDGSTRKIGHYSNPNQNIAVNLNLGGEIVRVQGGRLAWAVHYREWPPEHMAVMMCDGDRGNFRRDNLALVPRGKENALKRQIIT